ncbi:MAG: hypothetical protein QOE59_964, partial [Actinomycetota bacterium]|nr:hypothetical protein [Actinomycetota bacterium]
EVAARFADGAGTSASELARAAGPAMGDTRRHLYDESFVDGFLGAVPGLHERLRGGADVLDVGCGSGRTSALLADAFPRCRVVGLDIAPAAVARATADHGGREGLSFRQGDAADLDDDRAHDVVLAVDVVHDLPHPERTLRALRRALRDDGLLVLVDVAFPSDLPALLAARDLRDAAADAYAISVLYCLPSSLADGGSGWGAMIGRERLVAALEAAGFEGVEVHASPRSQNAVYVARPSLSDGPRA